LELIGEQDHNDIRHCCRLGSFCDFKSSVFGLRPRAAAAPQPDNDIDA
jgi:hypothetical protein